MKITGKLADKLLEIVNTKCKDDVHLRSQYGDDFNLKSRLTQYIAISAMAAENGDALELFCDSRDDEKYFMEFFEENPEILGESLL